MVREVLSQAVALQQLHAHSNCSVQSMKKIYNSIIHVLSYLPSFLPTGKIQSKPERKSILPFTRLTAMTPSALTHARLQETYFHEPISPSSNHGYPTISNARLFTSNLCFSGQREFINLWYNKSENQYLQASLKRWNRLTQHWCWQISKRIWWFPHIPVKNWNRPPRGIIVPGSA